MVNREWVLIALLTSAATALAVDLPSVDRGWYTAEGEHTVDNENYLVGQNAGSLFNNFFVFDPTGISQPITAARLRLYVPDLGGLVTDEAFEIYEVFTVDTPVEVLVDGTGGAQAYTDLGSGTSLGETVATRRDVDRTLTVPLNAEAVQLLSEADGLVALGGALPTFNDTETFREGLFGASNGTPGFARLVVDTADAPIGATAVGLAGVTARCDNVTDPQSVVASGAGDPVAALDCEAAGLTAAPGDQIRLVIAAGAAPVSAELLEGTLTGLDITEPARCINVSRPNVVGWPVVDGVWDCRRARFDVRPGDAVRVLITGTAR
ncbi:MAG: hypothetical protein AAF184_06025 [Pseudomonadota bacterium]